MPRPDLKALLKKLQFWKIGSQLDEPERTLVRGLLVLGCLCAFGVTAGLSLFFHSLVKSVHSSAHVSAAAAGSRDDAEETDDEGSEEEEASDEEPGEDEELAQHEELESEEGTDNEGSGEVHLGASPFPKDVLNRQDGSMEPDHDLVDPEIERTRNVASTIANSDLKVSSKLYRFVEIQDIFAGTRNGRQHAGHFMGDVVLELENGEAEKEVMSRKTELQSVIMSIVAERQQEALKTREGKDELKEDIQRELNHLVHSGKVLDVLFTNYLVK